MRFSADVLRVPDRGSKPPRVGPILRAWPKPESALFPGLTIVALAVVGSACGPQKGVTPRFCAHGSAMLASRCASCCRDCLCGWSIRCRSQDHEPRPRRAGRGGALAIALLVGSRAIRAAAAPLVRVARRPVPLIAAVRDRHVVGAAIHARGRAIASLNRSYALLYRFVPGFDGLRVAGRFAMIVAFALAGLVGIGVAAIDRDEAPRARRDRVVSVDRDRGRARARSRSTRTRPCTRGRSRTAAGSISASPPPPVYRFVASLPSTTAIVELPLGEPAFDVRYMFYSTLHWKPLVNGYSGGDAGRVRAARQTSAGRAARPDRAWQALRRHARHACHRARSVRTPSDRGRRMSAWLQIARRAARSPSFGTGSYLSNPLERPQLIHPLNRGHETLQD